MRAVATFGSHSALQILKGAHDEGLRSIVVCERKRESLYRRFPFIDEFVLVDEFTDILDDSVTSSLKSSNAILVPHGTMVAKMSESQIDSIDIPVFGNNKMLHWESDRELKEQMMREAKLDIPKSIKDESEIRGMTIAKKQGAAGGQGYFIAADTEEFKRKREQLISAKMLKQDEQLYLQEYIPGVLAYLQYFYSPLDGKLELFGVDSRHESDIDGLSRTPADVQIANPKTSSFTIIGNSPLVLRESLLPKVYEMGEAFVKTAAELAPPGMTGPFCLEGVYDENAKFTTFEFSARIVAGTNIFMDGSPYTSLLYDEPMSMGRRIAREIRNADEQNKLDLVTS